MIYELQNGPVSYDENRLSNLIFNPLNTSFNETIDQFTIGSGLDPDFNYYSGAHNCDYYTEDGFSAKLRSQGISNSLSFLHLNIRSLQRNFDNFSNLLLKININFTFIGLSETWLKDQLCKSWMTKGLLKSIKKKNNLYRKYLRKPTCENNTIYKNYKNKLNHSIRIAKRLYFENKLRNSTSNIKQTWQILNEVTNRKKSRNNFPSMFSCDNQDFSDPTAIANRFCEYFTNIGFNLAKEIPNSSRTACSYLNGNFLNSLFLNSVSKEEIVEIVNSFRSGAAPGYDNIPIKIVKNSIDLISEPLCELMNSSIISGIVPDQMKIARIVPIFKLVIIFCFPIIDPFRSYQSFLR